MNSIWPVLGAMVYFESELEKYACYIFFCFVNEISRFMLCFISFIQKVQFSTSHDQEGLCFSAVSAVFTVKVS